MESMIMNILGQYEGDRQVAQALDWSIRCGLEKYKEVLDYVKGEEKEDMTEKIKKLEDILKKIEYWR